MDDLKSYIVFIAAFFLLYGCATTKVYHSSYKRYKATRSVEILSRTPQRPYIVIATLEAGSPRYQNGEFVFEKMRNRAQRIGAHAIIPVEFHSIPDYSTAPLKPAYTPTRKPGEVTVPLRIFRKQPKSWAKALAIRYTESEEEGETNKTDSKEEFSPDL